MRYEAELLVALMQLERGTASDISRISHIPRSRVYDVAQGLEEKGLVEIQRSRPIIYRTISLEMALAKLKRQHEQTLQRARQTLQNLLQERKLKREHRGEFWIVSGLQNVSARVEAMMRAARQSILFSALLAQLVSQEMLDILHTKAKRSLKVIIASSRPPVLEQLTKAVPEAKAILLPHYPTETGAPGRLVIVDQKELLLSTLGEEELPEIPQETAIWSDAPGFASTVSLFVEMAAKAWRAG